MEGKEKLGQFIMQKRKEQNLTQKELAGRLYVTESAVSKWERGLSYPDISLVTGLCEILHITEHELIIAGEDALQKKKEDQAQKYRKIHTIYNAVLFGCYGLSLIICLISDFFDDYHLSWFFIVLTAEMTAASLLNVPSLVPRRKGTWTIGASLVSLSSLLWTIYCFVPGRWIIVTLTCIVAGYVIVFLPYLLLEYLEPVGIGRHKTVLCMIANTIAIYFLVIVCVLCADVPVKDLQEIAVPITTVGVLFPWALALIIRYVKGNGYKKASVCLGFTAAYLPFCGSMIEAILNHTKFYLQAVNFGKWDEVYGSGNVALISAIAALLLAIIFAFVEKKMK